MKRRKFLAVTGVASITTLAGCGGVGGGPGTVNPDDIAAEVTMTEDDAFDPPRVSIDTGEAVEWTNETGDDRTVVSNENTEYSSELPEEMELAISDGESSAFVFEESGIYTYHDQQRTWEVMCGAVAVGDNSEDDIGDLVCEGGTSIDDFG